MEPVDRAELEADRIRRGKCPKCGVDVKDKGSCIRCTVCPRSLTNGEWNDEGYVIDRTGDDGMTPITMEALVNDGWTHWDERCAYQHIRTGSATAVEVRMDLKTGRVTVFDNEWTGETIACLGVARSLEQLRAVVTAVEGLE